MATLAKGSIILVNVNDAYTASLTPDSCVIRADFDGSNPQLDSAYTNLSIVRGDEIVNCQAVSVNASHEDIQYELLDNGDNTIRLKITSIPFDIVEGSIEVEVRSGDTFTSNVTFQFSVVRETSMLDWILDWETNKTVIGDSYLITPKLFIGKKIENEEGLETITGVYIGPDSPDGAGIYGYKEGDEIFYINEYGGSIGGWEINNGGIQSPTGNFKILSTGKIESSDINGQIVWGLYESGEAEFAKGNVKFKSDGSAFFNGEIQASKGEIGGWQINSFSLFNSSILFDSKNSYIGISPYSISPYASVDGKTHLNYIAYYGGIGIYYNSANDFGLVGYLPVEQGYNEKIFSLGSLNKIANWNFDRNSIWIGDKCNETKQYTSREESITLGSNGLRGYSWYIDTDGSVSFAKGSVLFNADGGSIVGWALSESRLSTSHIVLVSEDSYTGIYLSPSVINGTAPSELKNSISSEGGICMFSNESDSELSAYNKSGKCVFKLSANEVNSIAGWSFVEAGIYSGNAPTYSDFTPDQNITIAPTGIRGCKWRLEADGSGAVAGGNIQWDSEGKVTFAESVSLSWNEGINNATDTANNAKNTADNAVSQYNNLMGTYLTKIDSTGIYTGTLCADNITAGTLSTASITNQDNTWRLDQDGSGYLANGKVSWDVNGNLKISGEISALSGSIGLFNINSNGLCYIPLDTTTWANAENMAQVYPGTIRIAKTYIYGNNVLGAIKVGLGEGADPTFVDISQNSLCPCAAYIYRRKSIDSIDINERFYPAVKIVSDNSGGNDVAIYTKGAAIVDGSLCSVGHFIEPSQNKDANDVYHMTSIDPSNGSTIVIRNIIDSTQSVSLPKLSDLQLMLNTSDRFAIPICYSVAYGETKNISIYFHSEDRSSESGISCTYKHRSTNSSFQRVILSAGGHLPLMLIYDFDGTAESKTNERYYAKILLGMDGVYYATDSNDYQIYS